jgi:toxin FitB
MKYLLDTSVISELISKQPNQAVIDFVDAIDQENLYLSVITIGELTKAIHKVADPIRKRKLAMWMEEELLTRFEGNIIPLDHEVMFRWGEITARLEKSGTQLPAIDSMIVAIVLTHRLSLVTASQDDFEKTGIQIVNPWLPR